MIIDTSRIASALVGLVGWPTLSANPKSRATATFVVVLRMRRTSLQALVLHSGQKGDNRLASAERVRQSVT
jgi:hypothetical protein